MSDDLRHKMSPIVSSLMISAGIVLLCHFLFGPCGYVSVKSSIKNMNKIFYGWLELRDATIPAFSKNGAVTYETIKIMEEWRTLAYQLIVPGCLDGARSTLIDAIESDYQTFHLSQDRITVDKKLEYLLSNDALFVRYKQNVDLIEACAPTCNIREMLYKIIPSEERPK